MVDTLELLPKDHPTYEWALNNMQSLARELLKVQDASGFWRTLLHDREAYLESSTAAFFGGAFLRAMRLGLLGAEFGDAAERAWRTTASRIDGERIRSGLRRPTTSHFWRSVTMSHWSPCAVWAKMSYNG